MASGRNSTMVNVPAQYAPLVQEMASSTGIPYDIIAAQADVESGFNATATSSAGAEGWMQFLPSTYGSYAAQAGVPANSEFNPADEAKVYDVYMGDLLRQEQGNIKYALAAYNAGPGNVQAGIPYANKILAMAGQPNPPPVVPTTGFPGIPGFPSFSISGILGNLFGDLRDILERLGLILLGAALILLGIHILSGGGGTKVDITEAAGAKGGTKKAASTGAKEAAEAAVVA